jgi:DNA-binding MarR family transcriptional regulator
MLLRMLERHPGLTATEVAAEMSLSPAAITGLINKLEDDGLVERRRERDDRRVVRLILTDRARAATKAMRQSFQASMQHTLQPLSDEELETLARLVEKALAGSARPGTATQRAGAGSRRLRPLDRPLRVARTTGPRAARGRRERAPASSRRRGARGE